MLHRALLLLRGSEWEGRCRQDSFCGLETEVSCGAGGQASPLFLCFNKRSLNAVPGPSVEGVGQRKGMRCRRWQWVLVTGSEALYREVW